MSRKAALDALAAGSLLLPFLAPSLRLAPVLRPRQSRRALSAVSAAQAVPQVRVYESTAGLAGWEAVERTSSSWRGDDGGSDQEQQMQADIVRHAPVASTSAVRLDSPSPPPPRPVPSSSRPRSATVLAHTEAAAALSELPAALCRVRAAYAASPDASPPDIVRQARPASYTDDDAQHPPIPPPLIPLDPQPGSSKSRLLAPFLLQALCLGASALGLLARRKVRTAEQDQHASMQRTAERERQAAEDRVDELQALDLLVAAYTVPEASSAQIDGLAWRQEHLRSVMQLVSRIDAIEVPVSRQTVASVLHFVSFAPAAEPDAPTPSLAGKYSLARPILGLWAWRAYESLPVPSPSSASPDGLDSAILRTVLSHLYPRRRPAEDRNFFPSEDNVILNSIAKRVLGENSSPSPALLAVFASTAVRASRVDLLERLVNAHPDLGPRLRLSVVTSALQLLAEDAVDRRRGQLVARWADRLVDAIANLGSFSSRDLRDIGRALRRLREDFEVPCPLESYLARAVVALLESRARDPVLEMPLVLGTLRHLVQSRNPRLARRVFDAIPPAQLSLAHFEALLASSHAPLAKHAWDALAAHPTLQPTAPAYEAYLSSLCTRDPSGYTSSTRLRLAYRAFSRARRAGVPVTTPLWNSFLRVCALHGPNPQLRMLLRRMESDRCAPDEHTAALLVERDMRRQDCQTRRLVVVGPHGEREERVVRTPRRVAGQAQMRRVRAAAHEVSARLAAPAAEALHLPLVDNLVIKNALRWPREFGLDKVIVLARARLGIDLAPLVDVADPAQNHAQVRKVIAAAAASSPVLGHEAWRQEREPALRMFASALEKRGREDLARVVRRVMRDEAERVREEERAARRRARAREDGAASAGVRAA